jgi:hypothetical protein
MSTRPLSLRLVCALAAALAGSVIAADTAVTDGLTPEIVRGLDKAWQKPGADLSVYTGLLIKPVTVSFSKSWRPREYGPFGLRPQDVERIRARHAEIADAMLARGLSKGGRSIATAPGAKVLEIQTQIVDLYVNAPDDEDVFTRSYVRNAGEMRLLVTLRDSLTGEVLFHGSDFKRGDETGRLQWANSVYNRVEIERTLGEWARQLRGLLDRQEAMAKKKAAE